MKKKKISEEIDLYVDSRPLTKIEEQEISDYIAMYKKKKSTQFSTGRTRSEKAKKELV